MGVTIPLFSESVSGITKKLIVRLRIWIQGRNQNTTNNNQVLPSKFQWRQNLFTTTISFNSVFLDISQTATGEGLVVLLAQRQAGQERDDNDVPAALHLPALRLHRHRRHLLRKVRTGKVSITLSNDRRPGRLRDSKIMVDFKILVDRLLNHDRHMVHQDLAPEMEL